MGLISEMVMVKWNGYNKEYYQNKGYIFTNINDEFEIKANDLPNSSSVLVNVKCDCIDCENPYLKPIKWSNYKRCVKKDGKYYCYKCAMKLYAHKNAYKTRLKNSKSFEQWCIENNYINILDLWDYDLNDCKPSEITYGTNKKYYFKCPRELHKSELKSINSFTTNNILINCSQCNSLAQYLIDNLGDNALENYWDYDKNTVNPWEVTKMTHRFKVWIRCQEKYYHESYNVYPCDFVNGSRCPYCCNYHGKVHLLDSLGSLYPDVLKIWSDKNKKSPYKYTSFSQQEVYWKCPDGLHEDYSRKISNSNRANFYCPECFKERDESFLQEKVRLYLNELNYIILHENKCNVVPINPKTKHKLPFDNEVKELKLIIEVHGLQHYEICGWHISSAKTNNTTPEYQLHYQKVKDKYKRIFAKRQGYFYLEIPYWTDDSEETWKKLIDDKVKEVKLIIERNS